MKRPGIYMTKEYGVIWYIEKVEYFPKSVATDKKAFSIAVSGTVGGSQRINRCLIMGKQFKQFVRIGDL